MRNNGQTCSQQAEQRAAGWDVFSLQFRLAEPLATLMPAAIARGYEQLQQLLLRIEQAQHALCRAWSHFRTSQHCLNTIQRLNRAAGTTVPGTGQACCKFAASHMQQMAAICRTAQKQHLPRCAVC